MQQTRLKRNSVFHAFLVLSTLLNVSVGTLQLHAQRIVSPEMMKEKFLHVSDTTKLMLYDKMFDADEYICKNPKLRNVRDMELPPSNWGLMIGNEQKGFSYENETRYLEADEKCILCWMGLRMGSVKEETSIRKKLKIKYGSIPSADGKMEGIPVRLHERLVVFMGVAMFAVAIFPDLHHESHHDEEQDHDRRLHRQQREAPQRQQDPAPGRLDLQHETDEFICDRQNNEQPQNNDPFSGENTFRPGVQEIQAQRAHKQVDKQVEGQETLRLCAPDKRFEQRDNLFLRRHDLLHGSDEIAAAHYDRDDEDRQRSASVPQQLFFVSFLVCQDL